MASAQNIRAGGAHVELWVNDRMTAGLRRASMSLRRFGRLSEDVSRRLLRAGTMMALPIAAAGRQFAIFEHQMAEVSTMLDVPSKHMERFSKEIISMSIQFGKGTDELSKGLYNILSATIDASKAIEVLAVSSKAAVAGLTDTATAASTIAGVLNAYGLSAAHAEDVSDILFTTVKRGQTTFAELSGFIGKVTSIAATAGVEFHELGAAIALVTRAGIPTEVALTGIRQALAKMVKPAHQSAVLFKKLFGMEMNPRTIKAMGGLEKFLVRVAKTANDEQTAILFPEVRALTSMLPLLRNTKELREDLEAMENRAGATQKAYDKMASTIGHQFNQLKMAGKALLIVIGEELKPVLSDLIENMMRLVLTAFHWVKHNGKMVVQFVFLTAKVLAAGVALKIFAVILNSLATVINVLIVSVLSRLRGLLIPIMAVATAVKLLGEQFGKNITWLEAMAVAFAVVTTAVIVYKAVMLAATAITATYVTLTSAWGAAIAFIAVGMGVLGAGLLQNRAILNNWSSGLTDIFDDAKMGFGGILDAIKAGEWKLATEIAVDTMKLVWSEFWQWMKEGWQNAMDGVNDILADRAAGWKSGLAVGRETLKEGVWDTADAIKGTWRNFIDTVSGGSTWERSRARAESDAALQKRRMRFDEAGFNVDLGDDLNRYSLGGKGGMGARIAEIQAAQFGTPGKPGGAAQADAWKAIVEKRKQLRIKAEEAKAKAAARKAEKAAAAAAREKDLQDMLTKGTAKFDDFKKLAKMKGAKMPDLMPGNLDVGTGVAAGRMKTGALNAMAAIRLGMETGAPNSWVQRNTTANEQTAASVKQLLLEVQSFGVED